MWFIRKASRFIIIIRFWTMGWGLYDMEQKVTQRARDET